MHGTIFINSGHTDRVLDGGGGYHYCTDLEEHNIVQSNLDSTFDSSHNCRVIITKKKTEYIYPTIPPTGWVLSGCRRPVLLVTYKHGQAMRFQNPAP